MRVEFFVTPLDIGSGIARPATVTYKRQEGASETQVQRLHLYSIVCHPVLWLLSYLRHEALSRTCSLQVCCMNSLQIQYCDSGRVS